MPAFFRDILESTSLKSFTPPYRGFSHPNSLSNTDNMEDGSIILYAKLVVGCLVIGRYMYETDGLPQPWIRHLNTIDEVWVPSQWQKETFKNSGAIEQKMQVGFGSLTG